MARSRRLRRGGGHYIDIGASQLVIDGAIDLRSGVTVERIEPRVAEKVGRCWGVGSDAKNDPDPWEDELGNMWKPTQRPGLWFHGGNLMQSRRYSLFTALQLKARLEGIATPVHGLAPVHHRH